MYAFPALAAAHQALWDEMRTGVADAPELLDLARRPVPDAIGPEILFTQACSFPLLRRYRGQALMLGTPCYELDGCESATHWGRVHRPGTVNLLG